MEKFVLVVREQLPFSRRLERRVDTGDGKQLSFEILIIVMEIIETV